MTYEEARIYQLMSALGFDFHEACRLAQIPETFFSEESKIAIYKELEESGAVRGM